MRKILLSLLLFVLSSSIFAQYDSVLRNFKYRIDHFRAYSLSINQSGQYYKSDYFQSETSSRSVGGDIGAGISTIRSTDKILLTTSGNINTNYNLNKATGGNSESRLKGFALYGQYNILNKWFSKQNFVELGGHASLSSYTNRNERKDPDYILKSNQTNYSAKLYTGIGKGRLENITDMQNAVWLMKALQESSSLSRILSPEELNGLGRAVTKANNTRVLDARKRTQYVLSTVDNYLQSNNLISKTDINYFSNLNDILFFAFNNTRLSGTEKFIRLTPAVQFQKIDDSNSSSARKSEKRPLLQSAVLSIGFNRYKPVNLKHQNNYGVALKVALYDFNTKEREYLYGVLANSFEYDKEIKEAGAAVFYEHAIYPNTRTIISLNLFADAGVQHSEDDSRFYMNSGLTGTISYFISYRTRLFLNTGVTYTKNRYDFTRNYFLQPDILAVNAGAGLAINF